MIKAGNYITIQAFMVSDLKLKGNELLIYAIIYGFTQTDGQRFTGSLQYLAEWTNSTKQGVQKALKSLVAKGILKREDKIINNVKFVEYWALTFNEGMQQSLTGYETKLHGGMQQSLTGYETKLHGGMQQSCTNNINNNIDILNNNNIDIKEKPARHKYGEYKNVLLTDADIEKLKTEFASDWQQRIEKLSIYKASTGKTYKNDLATIRNWARRDKEEKPQPIKKAAGDFVKGDLPF